MFQYAAAHALAARRNTTVVADTSSFKSVVQFRDFELWRFPKLGLRPVTLLDVAHHKLRSLLADDPRTKLTYRNLRPEFDEEFLRLFDGSYVSGHLQSVRYFEDCADDIRNIYDLGPRVTPDSTRVLQQLRSDGDLVSVHVRRGDYVNRETHDLDLTAYYQDAMSFVSARGPAQFLVFSDDLAWCKRQAMFKGATVRTFDELSIPTECALDEMALMASCDHNIIGNSTFSWWAAWLNETPGKVVAMPRQWLSGLSTDECGLSVPGWEQI